MSELPAKYDADGLRDRIFTIRGEKVILDADLATIYGVQTKVLNQAVKRHADKFPADFMFRLAKYCPTQIR
ncbi:MAG: ORF6N domain-containing protein [Kiritimatiellae bacterium]|nr:ORF6N domain-containing protein [Kiritimatiellia bacterium]